MVIALPGLIPQNGVSTAWVLSLCAPGSANTHLVMSMGWGIIHRSEV